MGSNEFCPNCGDPIERCQCSEKSRDKKLFILGIASIAIGIGGFLIAFLI